MVASHAQQRLWFLDRLEGGSTAYHLSGEWQLQGRLDDDALQRSLDALAERHDSLRTVFTEDETHQVVPRVLPARRCLCTDMISPPAMRRNRRWRN